MTVFVSFLFMKLGVANAMGTMPRNAILDAFLDCEDKEIRSLVPSARTNI